MPLRDRRDPKPRLDGPRAAPTTKYTRTPSLESDRDRPVPRLHSSAQRSSVYVAVVIAGALVGEKVRHSEVEFGVKVEDAGDVRIVCFQR